jgi:hypothetical protein
VTDISTLVSPYNLCSHMEIVRIVDGFLSLMSGKGFISVTASMSLSFVLYIPNFATNLFPIAHITHELNCSHLLF